jgi:hypothetical protein
VSIYIDKDIKPQGCAVVMFALARGLIADGTLTADDLRKLGEAFLDLAKTKTEVPHEQ